VARVTYPFERPEGKLIEKLIDHDVVAINHITLPGGDEVPEHEANSNVYLIILRGEMTLRLTGQEEKHAGGTVVAVDYGTRMHIRNTSGEILEFFVVKAPSPRLME